MMSQSTSRFALVPLMNERYAPRKHTTDTRLLFERMLNAYRDSLLVKRPNEWEKIDIVRSRQDLLALFGQE